MEMRAVLKRGPCPHCEAANAATHPLAIGAVVTIFRVRDGQFMPEGIATILRTSSEQDTYFVRLNGADSRPRKRLIAIEWQPNPTRIIDLINRHLKQQANDACNSTTSVRREAP
jgi:hypothetical protein